MPKKICVEQYINFNKSTDLLVYEDGKLVDHYDDCPYKNIEEVLKRIKDENKDAVIEQFCSGELCTGGWIRWELE